MSKNDATQVYCNDGKTVTTINALQVCSANNVKAKIYSCSAESKCSHLYECSIQVRVTLTFPQILLLRSHKMIFTY